MTPRFVRHFNLITITEFDDETYTRIYTAIADWWFRRARIPEEVGVKGCGQGCLYLQLSVAQYSAVRWVGPERELRACTAPSVHALAWMPLLCYVFPQVRLKGPAVVKATIEIYNTIRKELLPTPAKSHYTYNMRDLSKVFQGMQVSVALLLACLLLP